MKIGIDLRVLQIGHQYRGIGEVTKQCLNRIFELALIDKGQPTFIFYEYNDEIDPKQFLNIPEDLVYEEIFLGKRPNAGHHRSLKEKVVLRWRSLYGNPLPEARQCDIFLQFDYALGIPKRVRTVLVAHDLIPYIFWRDYFVSPWVHFRNKAARTTLRQVLHNYSFKRTLKRSHKNATSIICVSDSTRHDLHKYLHISNKKMRTVHLGVSEKAASTGDVAHSAKIPPKPFLLFIGGVDKRRRRIDDIIAAYNNLKAEGHDIQLALVGDNFLSANLIEDDTVRKAVLGSSYSEDILTLGYIDDQTKQELYKTALAFVFPTTYEGFGIPVLEAMLLGCPVIAYNNSSIPEVGGKYAFYAKDWQDIWHRTEEIIALPKKSRDTFTRAAREHAKQFTWDKTGEALYRELVRG